MGRTQDTVGRAQKATDKKEEKTVGNPKAIDRRRRPTRINNTVQLTAGDIAERGRGHDQVGRT